MEQLPDELHSGYLQKTVDEHAAAFPEQSVDQVREGLVDLFGFPSWTELTRYVDVVVDGCMTPLEQSIIEDDAIAVRAIVRSDPGILRRQVHWIRRNRRNQFLPLAYSAYCGSVESIRVLLDAGVDIHAKDDQALRAASYFDSNIRAVELLLDNGADPNATTRSAGRISYSVFDYPCMTLAPGIMQLLIDRGAKPKQKNAGMIFASNERKPEQKAACINVLVEAGFAFPDTAPVAIHRRNTDRLTQMFEEGTVYVDSRFQEHEIFPNEKDELQVSPYAYVVPLTGGVTLLHLAVELCDIDMATFLLASGADVNARSDYCADGYGGWTPLFHSVATLHQPRRFAGMAALLLENGADPTMRGSIRKPLAEDGGTWATWCDVTAVDFARSQSVTDLVNEAALELIAAFERGSGESTMIK